MSQLYSIDSLNVPEEHLKSDYEETCRAYDEFCRTRRMQDLRQSKSPFECAILELLTTEKNYCDQLLVLFDYYEMVKYDEMKVISDQSIAAIFSNLDQLVKFHIRMLTEMLAAFRKSALLQEVDLDILFYDETRLDEYVSVYKVFCGNFYKSKYYALQEAGSLDKYKDYLQGGQSLASFMILPVQRVCRYPLILNEICKHTAAATRLIEAKNAELLASDTASAGNENQFLNYAKTMQKAAMRINQALTAGAEKIRQEEVFEGIREFLDMDFTNMGLVYENDLVYVKINGEKEQPVICSVSDTIFILFSRKKKIGERGKSFLMYSFFCHFLVSDLQQVTPVTEKGKGRTNTQLMCVFTDRQVRFRFLTKESRDSWFKIIESLLYRKSHISRRSTDSSSSFSFSDLDYLSRLYDDLRVELEETKATVKDTWVVSFDNTPIYVQHWVPPLRKEPEAVAIVISYNHIGFYKPVLNTLTEQGYAVLGIDVRGGGMTAHGGTFPNFLDEASMIESAGHIPGDNHRERTTKDMVCLIRAARQKYPGKKVILMVGGIVSVVTIRFVYKYAGQKSKMPDGILFCPFIATAAAKTKPLPILLWNTLRNPHARITTSSKASLTTRDQNYVYQSRTHALANMNGSVSYYAGSLAYLKAYYTKDRFMLLRDLDIPIGFMDATRNFIADMELGMKVTKALVHGKEDKRAWIIEGGYHDILSDAARHPKLIEAFQWLKCNKTS